MRKKRKKKKRRENKAKLVRHGQRDLARAAWKKKAGVHDDYSRGYDRKKAKEEAKREIDIETG